MNPIKFAGCDAIYSKNHPQYLPLPCVKSEDGMILTMWGGSIRERIKFLVTGKIRLYVMTFNQPLQPLKIEV